MKLSHQHPLDWQSARNDAPDAALQPALHPSNVVVIVSRSELAAHLSFFKWNVDPVGRGEDD